MWSHNPRPLNALYLPQFLSHLSLKTSHTPTFKPTACYLARRRPPCCDIIRGATIGFRRRWRGGASEKCRGCRGTVETAKGRGGWKKSGREAKSHIWHHHGGSLEKQLCRNIAVSQRAWIMFKLFQSEVKDFFFLKNAKKDVKLSRGLSLQNGRRLWYPLCRLHMAHIPFSVQ